jgi:hypothetical protein
MTAHLWTDLAASEVWRGEEPEMTHRLDMNFLTRI